VSDLARAFREVQARKELISRMGIEAVDRETFLDVKARVEEHVGSVDPHIAEQVVAGMAWTIYICDRYEWSLDEATDIAESLVANAMGNVGDLSSYSPQQLVELGVGAGLFTGLWLAKVADE
jgi:hypothetical protein